MNKSKIEWCDMTWNPVTGCLHGCEYCYARKIANRFRGNFDPKLHEERLSEPQKIKKPKNIFVCSMADLFGEWVPDEWIKKVFDACEKAPQHRYLFLTKNPMRYYKLQSLGDLPLQHFYGTTVTNGSPEYYSNEFHWSYLSIEPILGEAKIDKRPQKGLPHWVIIGAETGNSKNKIVPKREWIEEIRDICKRDNVPLFMKNSLSEIWGKPLIQEFPW